MAFRINTSPRACRSSPRRRTAHKFLHGQEDLDEILSEIRNVYYRARAIGHNDLLVEIWEPVSHNNHGHLGNGRN